MMKRFIDLFILLLICSAVHAQNIRVESFEVALNDATASVNPVLDANDEPCALIRVVTTDNSYDIDGNLKRIEKAGELLFYLPAGTRLLTIRHNQLGRLDYNLGERLQSKTTYRMVIPTNTIVIHSKDRGGHYLVLKVTPADAVVHVNGKLEETNDGMLQKFLTYGTHSYRVEAPLYKSAEGGIEIGREKKILDISLLPDFAEITLNADGAEIRVNNEAKGTGTWNGRLSPDTYLVETQKAGHRSATYTLVVKAGEDRTITLPQPTPMYASLDVSSNAVGSDVYVDGARVGSTPDIFQVLAGKHTVELRAGGYKSQSYTVELSEGSAEKLTANLEKTSRPADTNRNANNGNSLNGHEAVDLGLSVKWACCNVGADSPEEYGGYYAWGETEEKSDYSWDTYKWCKGSYYTMTKYCTKSSYGTVDNKTTLDPSDDVAHVKWGGSWRMTTKKELQQLIDNCTWQWTTQGGKKGYKVTSKKNGNSIFLPAAGYRYGSVLYDEGSNGDYWSSSLNEDDCGYACSLYFSSNYHVWYYWGSRDYGHTVRPVSE